MSLTMNMFSANTSRFSIYAARAAHNTAKNTEDTSVGVAAFEFANETHFSVSNGVFTCNRAGTYIVHYYLKSSYNTSSTLVKTYGELVDGANTVLSSMSTTDNVGAPVAYEFTAAKGDTISLKTRNTSNSAVTHAAFIVICTADET